MREMIKMVVVLTILSAFSGGLLAAVRSGTKERIENQELKFVKGPAIKSILEGASNDPIKDRFKIQDGDIERLFFVGIFDGKVTTVVFESFGSGYADVIGLMVGVNVDEDKFSGAGITTHKETPGLGAKAKNDPSWITQFQGLSANEAIKVTNDGGTINAISGATITSKAVCVAATDAGKIYNRLKPQIQEKLKAFTK